MFTGIVQDVGRVAGVESRGGDVRLMIACEGLDLARVRIGDSICVQGCCLTVTELSGSTFAADVSRETLNLTTLGTSGPERRSTSNLRCGPGILGGHLVSGHVGEGGPGPRRLTTEARSTRAVIGVPPRAGALIAAKGSSRWTGQA